MARPNPRPRPLLLSILLLFFAAPLPAQEPAGPLFPGQEWEYLRAGELEGFGWDREQLRSLSAFLRDSSNTTGLMVIDRGRVAFDFGDVQELSYLASCRKSVLAMLYGDWVEKGVIDLDCLLYTSPSPRDRTRSRMPSSA